VVKAAAVNNISSTVVRKQLRENRSAKYLITDGVISYIQTHGVHELPQWRS
jgi:nicotinic acid mononucleotide adenylyltransferase